MLYKLALFTLNVLTLIYNICNSNSDVRCMRVFDSTDCRFRHLRNTELFYIYIYIYIFIGKKVVDQKLGGMDPSPLGITQHAD